MTFSIYTAAVPTVLRQLGALKRIMASAEAYAAERKFDVNNFVEDRLAPDMNPFKFQVQSAADHAKFIVARLSGQMPPRWPDDETTFEQLEARVQKAIDYVQTFTEADLTGGEDRSVVMRIAGQERTITGAEYFLNRGLPNFYFHATTAYAILRKGGVPVGKSDYLNWP